MAKANSTEHHLLFDEPGFDLKVERIFYKCARIEDCPPLRTAPKSFIDKCHENLIVEVIDWLRFVKLDHLIDKYKFGFDAYYCAMILPINDIQYFSIEFYCCYGRPHRWDEGYGVVKYFQALEAGNPPV